MQREVRDWDSPRVRGLPGEGHDHSVALENPLDMGPYTITVHEVMGKLGLA